MGHMSVWKLNSINTTLDLFVGNVDGIALSFPWLALTQSPELVLARW